MLLGIGFLHALLWKGDILMVYALVSPLIILLRNRRPRTLFILGGATVLMSPVAAVLFQAALIGMRLYRNGVITGGRTIGYYRRTAVIGLGVGLPLAAIGLAWVAASEFSPDVAFTGTIPNTLGTVPVVMGYVSLIILWNRRSESSLHRRLRSSDVWLSPTI